MKDILKALQDFKSAGYKIDLVFTSKDSLPLIIEVEENNKISLSSENHVICTVTFEKIEGESQIVVHAGDEQIDLMEQFRSRMREELL